MKDAYTTKEMGAILGVTVQAIHEQAAREKWPFQPRRGRGGGKEFPTPSLPEAVRQAVQAYEAKRLAESLPAEVPAALALPRGRLIALAPGVQAPDRLNQEGLDKFAVVQLFRSCRDNAPRGTKAEAIEAFLVGFNSGIHLPTIRARLGLISRESVYRWDKCLKEAGDDYRALLPRRGKWVKGEEKKHGDVGADLEVDFLKCWLGQHGSKRPSLAMAYRALNQDRQGNIPSYYSFWRFAKRYEATHSHIVRLAREGEKALLDKEVSYLTRDWTRIGVGDLVMADGHTLNFEIIHPYTGKPARLKLIVFFDGRSRYPLGWCIMPEENTVAVSLALRMAILTLGKYPTTVLLDNGKAFKSEFFTGQPDTDLRELWGVYARLGISCHFSQPYRAQTKALLERWFGTFNEQCARLLTYVGRDISDKPAYLRRNETFHKALEARRTGGWIPDIQEASWIVKLFCDWYADQPHSGLGGQTPREVFEAGRGPGFSEAELAELRWHFLWRHRIQKPIRCGFQFNSVRYESDALFGWSQECLALFDLNDVRTAYLYTVEGQPLGEARPTEAVHPLAQLFGDQVSMDRIKTTLSRHRAQIRQTKAGLMQILGADEAERVVWNQSQPILAGERRQIVQALPAPEENAAELAELEAYAAALDARPEPAFIHERPQFMSERERYEWCLRHIHEFGLDLPDDDVAFMREFEASPEFERYRGYFENIKTGLALMRACA